MIGSLWLAAVLVAEALFAAGWFIWSRAPETLLELEPEIRAIALAFAGALAALFAATLWSAARRGSLTRLFDGVVRYQDPELRAAKKRVRETGSTEDRNTYARRLQERRRTMEAAEEYASVLEADGSNIEARYRVGLCLLAEKLPAEASLHFADVVRREPAYDGGRAPLRLAECLVRSGKAAGLKETPVRSALEVLEPEAAETHYVRALALEHRGRVIEARLEASTLLRAIEAMGRPLSAVEEAMRAVALRMTRGGAGAESLGGA